MNFQSLLYLKLTKSSYLNSLSKDPLDLLIIGTGKIPIFLSPKQQVEISEFGLGVECMNNSSACSSFNLLLGDLRKVGLLVL